ncbi:MAG TPA: SDR family NAD(P)-dependent oxidoreductase [Anaeromyxobacteraceae bacterium]|nr:SDR family NAD(P)-dependent oxidoreductase [Anaeromyxobacteraceae bacterium]
MTSTRSWPSFTDCADPLDQLVLLSRYFGSDPEMVLAGGGNTSVKVGDRLLVKGSGSALSSIGREGFVAMDRPRLEALAHASLPAEREPREAAYKKALYAARLEPERNQRPSVEALLHHLVPGRFVVHGHATVANALTCAVGGEAIGRELFGDEVVWVPFVDPGFALAQALRASLSAYEQRRGGAPRAVLMANHGIILAGDAPEAVRANAEWLLATVARRIARAPQAPWTSTASQRRADAVRQTLLIAPTLRGLLAEASALPVVILEDGDEALAFAASGEARAVAAQGPLSPDQIVYCNSFPLWFDAVEGEDEAALLNRLRAAVADHRRRTDYLPKVVIVPGVGIFCAGDDVGGARNCRLLYLDAIRVMSGAARLGGVQALSEGHRRFIETWEVEAYRKQIARSAAPGRSAGRIAVVTGAAQGFGLEIAQQFAAEGGVVVLADLNEDGARSAAESLTGQVGAGRALSAAVNVTDGASVAALIEQVVRAYGGFDVFIANAGVLKAGSVKTQSEQEFDFVTAVNYKGYFLCVKQAAPVLARQHAARPSYRSDIIQINSKSGLAGSNRNGAYAGSKFGGIGLTQSFALELVEDGIKVNAICPGNFFEGPLWSDPRTGLFVQYLKMGKVPGATTIEDVKRVYEAKVPMKRGCRSADVMRAIFYLIEQEYETGQALPVTGGQEMLK